jgi:putative tricarboxylic transport membrane protein
MAGTGGRREDQILTVGLERAKGTRSIYIPFEGGANVAVQRVDKPVDSTVNNPIMAVSQWRFGSLRPLCVFDDERMPCEARIAGSLSWCDIPTCKEAGVPTDYLMLRGTFMVSGVTPEQQGFHVELMKKVRATPEWPEYMERGAFNQGFMAGADHVKGIGPATKRHRRLMTEAGFMAR